MKNNSVPAGLVVVLALTVLMAGMWTLLLNRHTAHSRALQGRLAEIQNAQNVVQAIATDAVEYSKRNPAILPVLQPFNVPPNSAATPAPAATKPAAKSGTKTGTKTTK